MNRVIYELVKFHDFLFIGRTPPRALKVTRTFEEPVA